MMKKSRGVTIGTYITAMAVFAVLTMTMVAMAVQHLHFSTLVQQQQGARNLAEAVLNQALIEVLKSPNQTYGSQGLSSEAVRVDGGSIYAPGSFGKVTFHPLTAQNEHLPLSVNNFHGTGLRIGYGDRQVPVNTLHLVAQGRCGSARKTVEMLYHVPPFPNALASEGPVRSTGGLLVAGVKDPEKFPGSYDQVAGEDRSPSHVMSNFDSPNAVDLGAGAIIQGNVGAVGGVRLDPSVVVAGAVRQHMERQALPDLDLDAIFNSLNAQGGKDILPSSVGDYSLDWNAQCDTDLHVNGSLQLNNGVLFVRGNLTVENGVKGEGAIFVGGQTLIKRGSSLSASDQVAVVSRRKIVLDGVNRSNFFFQGLLYSEEEIIANNMTVLGAVIARGALELNEVNLINAPVTVSLIEGLELRNHSDDDTVQIIIRVEERHPETRQPLRYKVQLRGYSDDMPVLLGPTIERSGLTGYDDIKAFIAQAEGQVQGYKKNSYRGDWYWNASANDHSDIFGTDPLRNYLDALQGKNPDPEHRFTVNLNPNEVLGVLDRSRVLLWREAD